MGPYDKVAERRKAEVNGQSDRRIITQHESLLDAGVIQQQTAMRG
jgi:hypothetical protein